MVPSETELSEKSNGQAPVDDQQNGDKVEIEQQPEAIQLSEKNNGQAPADDQQNDDEVEIEIEQQPEPIRARTLTNFMLFINLFKVFTGPSILGTPAIIKFGGLLFGPIAFVLIGYLNNWCNTTVVKCCQILGKRIGQAALTYQELMEQCFLTVPSLQRVATNVRQLTTFLLAFTQFGLLSFYIKTIGTTAQEHLTRLGDDYTLSLAYTELFVALLLLPYSMMRSLRILSWFSLSANIITVVSAVTIIQFSCRHLQPVSEFPYISHNPWTIPLFVGGTVFTVEGIPMVLPLENKAKNPQDFGGTCGIITLATTFNICFNVLVGFYGYMAAGHGLPGNILVYLPAVGFYDAISIAFALSVFLTFSLQIYLPAELLARPLKSCIKADWIQRYADYIMRALLVIAAYLFAALIPKVELLMALVGAFSMALLVFVFPPLAELCVLSGEPGGIPTRIWIKDILIFTFGGIAFVTGTYTSLRDIILAF